MDDDQVECSFLIPLTRDAVGSDGRPHPPLVWEWLDHQLFSKCSGLTMAPGEYSGSYIDPEQQVRVDDQSRRFIVALPRRELEQLRSILRDACYLFAQKSLYLSVGGKVEFPTGKEMPRCGGRYSPSDSTIPDVPEALVPYIQHLTTSAQMFRWAANELAGVCLPKK
jgi:hypothetical protein